MSEAVIESNFVKSRAKLFTCKSEEEMTSTGSEKKTPSYVSLSCAVSGYSGLNRYDSKARQDFGSRDSSQDRLPLCLARSRDSSPSVPKPDVKHRLSTGLLLSNGSTVPSPPSSQGQSRSKSVDRGFLRQNFLNGYLQYKPPSGVASASGSPKQTSSANKPLSFDNQDERGRVRIRGFTVPATQNSKSVIQQRIERLYGPAALAGGFFMVKTPQKFGKEPLKSIPLNNNNIVNDAEAGEECCGPPVFRHLNAEFRQQLNLKKRSPSTEDAGDKPVVAVQITTPTESLAGKELTTDMEPGHHFLQVLEDEKKRLQCLIAKNELYLSDPVVMASEEMHGKIFSAVGKCKLLLAQKFEQFAGLCRKNLTQNQDEQFPTTGEDLAGFWDMVTIQVQHVRSLFLEIQTLRDNGWNEPVIEIAQTAVKKSRPTNNKAVKAAPRSAKAEEAARIREEARRKLMEEKRKLLKVKKMAESAPIPETPESETTPEVPQGETPAIPEIVNGKSTIEENGEEVGEVV